MTLIKMPSIGQFRQIIQDIKHQSAYVKQENDKPVYDFTRKQPTINFKGTVKLHGTNASVAYNGTDIWAQSKGNVITPEKDNAGFADFVNQNKDHFLEHLSIWLDTTGADEVVVYGEYAGKGIQKGVGIAELPKRFYPFGIKYKKDNEYHWAQNPELYLEKLQNDKIRSIFEFETFNIKIDFNDSIAVKVAQNKMIEFTQKVEDNCPVAGGIGEGIVWVGWDNDLRYQFKIKGEKHSKSKVKVPKIVTEAELKEQKVAIDFVESVVTEGRLEQMYQETFDTINGGVGDIKKLGDFLKAVAGDVYKEELDIIKDKNLERKQINPLINQIARVWFMGKLDQ